MESKNAQSRCVTQANSLSTSHSRPTLSVNMSGQLSRASSLACNEPDVSISLPRVTRTKTLIGTLISNGHREPSSIKLTAHTCAELPSDSHNESFLSQKSSKRALNSSLHVKDLSIKVLPVFGESPVFGLVPETKLPALPTEFDESKSLDTYTDLSF